MNIKHFQKILNHLSSRFCQKIDSLTSIWTVDLKKTDYSAPMWLPNQKYQGRKHGEKFRFRQKKFWPWNRYRDLIVFSVANNETRFRSYTTGRAHDNCRKMKCLIHSIEYRPMNKIIREFFKKINYNLKIGYRPNCQIFGVFLLLLYQIDLQVCILFEKNVFIFQFLNDKTQFP